MLAEFAWSIVFLSAFYGDVVWCPLGGDNVKIDAVRQKAADSTHASPIVEITHESYVQIHPDV